MKEKEINIDQMLRSTFQEVKAEKTFVVLLNGRRVRTNSGKSVWGNPGAAKNAVNNHINNISYLFREDKEDLVKEWVKNNIQIVSSADYEKTQKALKSK